MESAARPCHSRSKSTPVPESEPWGDYVSPCSSMILTCSGGSSDSLCGAQCGLGEALEGLIFPEEGFGGEDNNKALLEDITAPTVESNTTTTTTSLTSSSKNGSCDSLYNSQSRDPSPEPLVAPPSPSSSGGGGGYQKRGRFLIWPVSMKPPSLDIPFLGLSPQ